MSIQALREQRAAIAKSLHELVNKADWTADADQPVYDAGMAQVDDIDARIKRIADANEKIANETRTAHIVDAAEKAGRDNRDAGVSIYAKWLKGGDKALNTDDWQHIRNTMSTTTGSEGGFTVDSQVATSVLDALLAFGGMRSVATVIRTAGVGAMSFPTSDGTTEEGEIVAENVTASDADVTFGTIALPVYKFSSKVVTVPFELLQDSSVDVESFIRNRLVTRLGRITNKKFTIGSGSGEPHGIQVAASAGYTASNGTTQTTLVTYDSLVETQHSVDPAYREGGRARWMFNDDTLKKLRQVKDGSQRPIFLAGYENGPPGAIADTILGAPFTINQSMPDMAISTQAILYGDFSYYYIRDAMAVEMFRFTDSAFTKKGQVGFLAWMRTGGNLIDVGGAVKGFVNAAS